MTTSSGAGGWANILREPCEVDRSGVLAVQQGFGFASRKRNNVHLLNDRGVLLTTLGSAAAVLDTQAKSTELLFCPDSQGIGCVCVHPNRKYFAIGGQGNKPNVYIHEFPSRKLLKTLRGGTERAYSCMAFSSGGDKLATVGASPDFLLTVWDWESERIILRNKAFAQEIYNVSFAPGKDGFLTTSGLGHIRFWKMADTFTGLKLQGDIGKFGKVELSDVSAYAVMPDGKVLSGSESGSLLLWDGNFIKLEVRRPGHLLPHEGEVHVCELIGAETPAKGQFLTAGEDGWLRWWSMAAIDSADVTDENPFFELAPTRQFHVEGKVPISICVGEDYLILQDRNGGIYRLEEPIVPGCECIELRAGHSGRIAGVISSPVDHLAVTAGDDCSVRAWDYIAGDCLFQRHFNTSATATLWMPAIFDMTGRSLLVGFEDGVVRLLCADRASRSFRLVMATKPHNAALTAIALDESATRLATAGRDGTVFVFDVRRDGTFKPLGFVPTPSTIRALEWTRQGDRVLMACDAGQIIEVTLPHPSNAVPMPDTSHTFELKDLPMRTFTFKRRVPKPLEKPQPVAAEGGEGDPTAMMTTTTSSKAVQEEEEDPQQIEYERLQSLPVGAVLSFAILEDSADTLQFALALDGADAGPLYVCEFGSEYPLRTLPNLAADDGMAANNEQGTDLLNKDPLVKFLPGTGAYPPCTRISKSWSGQLFINGSATGEIRIRSRAALGAYASLRVHDGRAGQVTGMQTSFDDAFLLTAAADGSLYSHRLNVSELETRCKELEGKPGTRIKAKKLWTAAPNKDAAPIEASMLAGEPVYIGADEALQSAFPAPEPAPEAPATDANESPEATDILDANAYSIQDDKLKTEEDAKLRVAEVEKDKVRQVIADLRKDFEALVEENERDAPETRLPRDAFDIDNDLIEALMEEGKAQLEEVIKETQWDVNMSKAKLEKLKRFFLNEILVDSISLAAFNEDYIVRSFRTAKFSESLRKAIATLHEVLNDANGNGAGASGNGTGGSADAGGNGANNGNKSARPETEGGPGSPAAGKRKKKTDAATGWEARKAGRRERKLQMSELLEIKPDEDADDPVDVAAIEWVLNNMGDYKLKSAENYQVPVHLQVNAAKKYRQSILLAESVQALRMKFNEKFLALRELKRRIVERARVDETRIRAIDEELGEDPGSLGLPLRLDGGEWPEKRLELTPEDMETFLCGSASSSDTMAEQRSRIEVQGPNAFCAAALREVCADAKTSFEKAVWNTKRKQLLFEKSRILERSLESVRAFDSAVYELRKERAQLDADLVAAELRQILLFREQQLLNEFEKKDHALSSKLDSCRQQKSEVLAEITSCQENLAAKKAELAIWQEKDRVIFEEFHTLVGGDANPASAQLLKIFKRKIKRVKQQGDGDSDSEESDSEDDEDYDDEEEDFEEGEPEEERCPDGCDPAIYEKVLELREKRLDQEEVLSGFNKAIDELRKANDRHQGREKQIDKDLKSTVIEIQAFQNEKQRKLNEVDTFVVLRLAQLACLVVPEGSVEEDADADLDAALAAVDNDQDDTIFEEDVPLDSEDVEIVNLKLQLIQARDQLAALDEAAMSNAEDDALIERQDELVGRIRDLELEVRRARISAERTRRHKARLVLPISIGSSLVFDKHELHDLHAGIGRLLDENCDKKLEFKELHHMQKRLKREKKQKLRDIAALEDKCKDLQLLKFGQVIDLDTIEKMGSSGSTEVSNKAKQQEKKQHAEHASAQKKIGLAQERLLEATRRNSALLQQIASLTEKQQLLEAELNGANGGASHAAHGLVSHREAQETAKLTQLVKMQSHEIQALKTEIDMLRGNTGNMYTNRNQIMDP
ncbi:Echinoderm microtubule-associated protein-like 1 [Hondaea fermentalgiana]|uniref:Echinoderm microtubule-associated protein-like 1 n=1 Tax=Hondaea fermentalgiana TaxID=2315210 RepID=A0A2R5GDY3_9STRA|nr:Echinoderm microtubule-associated protein-like 1 [Hondaea fermentalgiana]|eukprot:GBG26863.1 Echinoderm microtubule-associated protein-like 1 [Hondaea fermentalgiana]